MTGSEGAVVARLVALDAHVEPQEVLLTAGTYEVGRSVGCAVVLRTSTVSRLHATIERHTDGCWLCDAGSTNGTYLNGLRIIGRTLLHDRDQIGLGQPAPLLLYCAEEPTVLRPAAPSEVVTALLYYCEAQYRFLLAGQPLHLPASQLRLLLHLYRHLGEVCTRGSCAEAVWGRPYDPVTDDGALDKIVSKLRRRLAEASPHAAGWVRNRRGVGYVLEW